MSKWNSAILSDAVELVIDYRGKTPKKLGSDWCNDDIERYLQKT